MANARFVILASTDKQFYFVLRAPNNEVILTGETYPAKVIAQEGIAAVKENAGVDARFERRVASNGAPYFVLKGANHEVIGQSELYASTSAREDGITSVQRHAPSAPTVDQT